MICQTYSLDLCRFDQAPQCGVSTALEASEITELIKAYEAGATTYALAEKWGVDRRTVSDHLRRAGVRRPYRRIDPLSSQRQLGCICLAGA
jgi:hypothetical protein